MAVRATSSYNTRSNSYSRPSTTQKSSAAAKTSTTSRSSSSSSSRTTSAPKTQTPTKTTSPTPKRDTFTYSSPSTSRNSAPKTNTAPKTNNTPKQGITPKQNTAPKTSNTPKQGITPKQNAATKTNNTPKQGITPKQNTAPKTNNTPKQGITPKQNTATKTNNTPKQGITPKQNTAPKTPTKLVTNNNTATTQQFKAPTKPASKSNTASTKLTNDEYSRLAAKAAGIAIGSNGKPAFTSYEQSMKYSDVLTNLHNGGINRNSTPQEIAAASVGTKLDKNGNPIISNVSQGQNYGSALKNVTPSKTKGTGNTGGGNNPQNKTNEKASGSVLKTSYSGVKPNSAKTASATDVGVVPNTNKQAKPINYRVTNAVSFLAAKNLGISTDSTGTPHISNPSDGKKFMEECDRLKKNEDKIIAAAAAGISVDRNGNPRIIHGYEATAYTNAYNEYRLKKLGVDLSTLQFGENSTVNTAELTKAKPYTVVPDDSPYAGRPGYITQTAYNTIVYTMAHESGTVGIEDTGNTIMSDSEMFAAASAMLNAIENPDCYAKPAFGNTTSERIKGFYEYNSRPSIEYGNRLSTPNDGTTGKTGEDAMNRASAIADYVLAGNRAFDSDVCYWLGNGKTSRYSTTWEENNNF